MVLELAAVGALKIAKRTLIDKKTEIGQIWPLGRFFPLFAAVLLACFGSASAPAYALPVTIAWELPLIHAESYLLEVAATPGFAEPLLKLEVRGTGYSGEVPVEGVYHWRLSRPGVKSESQTGAEESSLASGSFVALDPEIKRLSPPQITWDKVDQAERYKIYMLGPNANQRVVTVSSNTFLLPRVDEPTMLEVVPFSEGRRASRAFHLDPSLTLVSGAVVAQAGTPPLAPVASAPPPAPVVVKTETKPPRRRAHLVYLFGGGVQEQLEIRKLDLDLKSTTQQPGGGGGFWLNPAYGLILSGQADYHEHQDDTVRQSALFPGQNLKINQSRFTADISIGYNLLDFFGVRRVVFAAQGTAAVAQVPLVPADIKVTPPSPPPLNKTRLSLVGGGASFGYLGTYFAMMFEGGGLTDNQYDGRLVYQRLLVDIYLSSVLSLELGAFNRSTQASHCAATADVCLTVGASTVDSRESGVILGLGAVLF